MNSLILGFSGLVLGLIALIAACKDKTKRQKEVSAMQRLIGLSAYASERRRALPPPQRNTATQILLGFEGFSVRTPLPVRADSVGKTNRPLVGQRFLVVSSDESIQLALGDLVHVLGGMVDIVDGTIEAVTSLSFQLYDAAIIDRDIHGPDADDLARHIRGEFPSTTTVMLGNNIEEDEELFDKALPKMFDEKSVVSSLLNSGRFQIRH